MDSKMYVFVSVFLTIIGLSSSSALEHEEFGPPDFGTNVTTLAHEYNGEVLTKDRKYEYCTCTCPKPQCVWPRTKDECRACADAFLRPGAEISFYYGSCWMHMATGSESLCVQTAWFNLLGCEGFSGTQYYPGSKKCWATFHKP